MKTIVVTPDPALLESMRSIGYTIESAVADVIDNSVAANASNVEILFSSSGPFEIAVVDDGTGMSRDEAVTAMRLAATLEGLILDPVYSAKGMAGLIATIRNGVFSRERPVVFVHTGGQVGLFAYDEELRCYGD